MLSYFVSFEDEHSVLPISFLPARHPKPFRARQRTGYMLPSPSHITHLTGNLYVYGFSAATTLLLAGEGISDARGSSGHLKEHLPGMEEAVPAVRSPTPRRSFAASLISEKSSSNLSNIFSRRKITQVYPFCRSVRPSVRPSMGSSVRQSVSSSVLWFVSSSRPTRKLVLPMLRVFCGLSFLSCESEIQSKSKARV